MRKIPFTFLLGATLLFTLFGCDTTEPVKNEEFAYLELYWNNQLQYSEKVTEIEHESTVEVQMPDNSTIFLTRFKQDIPEIPDQELVWNFGCLAANDGFYSICKFCTAKDTIRIYGDTDFTLTVPNRVCGLIYNTNFGPTYYAIYELFDQADSSSVMTISTDEYGRYAYDIPMGNYFIMIDSDHVEFTIDDMYQDIRVYFTDLVEKPNIYIYPEKEIMLNLNINFPKGGRIVASEPDYRDGWKNIKISPDGKIDEKHNFLFYEVATSEFEIPQSGWVIAQKDLEDFFIKNLNECGFAGREIDDFIEFWIPILVKHHYYEIYPNFQAELDKRIVLEFSIKPDNMQRLIYIIKGRDEADLKLKRPTIPSFERKGYFVTEWGVIIK